MLTPIPTGNEIIDTIQFTLGNAVMFGAMSVSAVAVYFFELIRPILTVFGIPV